MRVPAAFLGIVRGFVSGPVDCKAPLSYKQAVAAPAKPQPCHPVRPRARAFRAALLPGCPSAVPLQDHISAKKQHTLVPHWWEGLLTLSAVANFKCVHMPTALPFSPSALVSRTVGPKTTPSTWNLRSSHAHYHINKARHTPLRVLALFHHASGKPREFKLWLRL